MNHECQAGPMRAVFGGPRQGRERLHGERRMLLPQVRECEERARQWRISEDALQIWEVVVQHDDSAWIEAAQCGRHFAVDRIGGMVTVEQDQVEPLLRGQQVKCGRHDESHAVAHSDRSYQVARLARAERAPRPLFSVHINDVYGGQRTVVGVVSKCSRKVDGRCADVRADFEHGRRIQERRLIVKQSALSGRHPTGFVRQLQRTEFRRRALPCRIRGRVDQEIAEIQGAQEVMPVDRCGRQSVVADKGYHSNESLVDLRRGPLRFG